ncbi:50S ribosomal protein L29 [Bombiscardovia nodaiensis]|uniref:Large ribosomal subunit protein uL29 n=1 Tax=Bombiscardovia nodaiensis TaxID=2932181 RepID=A0ABM8B6T9_9BIFI|nr:50S ribosomal protein L29 [Bombiscardovia nodaiensis]
MTVGTAEYSIKNLNEKTDAQIEDFLKKSKEELFNLRFQAATGQLENSARLKAVKHDIARMYTVLRERELGISQAPEADAESSKSEAEEK